MALIRISLITSNKQAVSEDHILEIAELIQSGKRFPPIVVRRIGDAYRLVDGRHRLAACKLLGYTHILARITL